MIRIVEIFPRFSTAEILSMDPGADIRMMGAEAKQGLVRIKMLTADEQMDVQNVMTRKAMVRSPTIMAPSMGNPDGAMKSIVPEFRIGGGSAAETNLPDRAYKLVSNAAFLAQADTSTVDPALENFNSSILAEVGVRMPLSNKVSLIGRLGIGAATKLAVGGKFFPGPMFGSGVPTPGGHVGEPAPTVTVGYGGKGASALPAVALGQLTSRKTLVTESGFVADLGDTVVTMVDVGIPEALQARVDSAYQAAITDSIRASAKDSLSTLASRGLGFGLAVDIPLTEQIKVDASINRFGSVEELSFGVTYYTKRMGMGKTNPDGVLRSLIGQARLILDSNADKTYLDLGLTYPMTPQYTVSAGFISDFGGFSQFGLAVRGYISRN
jgi:hypothetical protein